MSAGGLCLGRSEVSCWAKNRLSSASKIHSFSLNNHTYKPFKESYFVFSSNEMLSADSANEACTSWNSTLAHIPDKATQRFLERKLAKMKNRPKKSSKNTWIGLRLNKDGIRLWPDQQVITYSNWDDGEPNQNFSCTFISESNKWKTQTCSETSDSFKAHYICHKPGREIPTFINIASPPCHNGNSSELHVTWQPSPYMTQINHTLTLIMNDTKEVIQLIRYNLTDKENRNETYSHLFYGLKPQEKYKIKIDVDLPYCSKPISTTSSQMSGYVTPEPLSNATLRQPSNVTCIVSWTWPQDKEHTIEHFVVKVEMFPNITRNDSYKAISELISREYFQRNVTSQNRSTFFSALPNRRHVIEVFGQSCAGNGVAAKAIGECIAPVSGPSNLTTPSQIDPSSDNITLMIQPPDETNGLISCYFLVAQIFDSSQTNNKTTSSSQSFLDNLASTNLSEADSGLPYLAVAVKHFRKTFILISLGNNQTTSCDVNDVSSTTSSTRQRRSATQDGVYQAQNYPLRQNQTYLIYILSTTPSFDDKISFVSSDVTMVTTKPSPTVEPVPVSEQSLVWVAAPAILLLLVVIILALVFHRRRKVSLKPSAELRYHVCDDQTGDKPQKPLEIPIENITMLNKLGEGHFSEVWRARISYKNFNFVEAAAKIIKGAQLTAHQHQEFEMELELMHLLGQNPFVIQLYGISQDKDRKIALTELVMNGDLHQFLLKNRPVPSKDYEPMNPLGTKTMTKFSRDIASGMDFISSMNLVHRDLACRNVLLTEELRCKISDFGLSRQVTETEGVYVKLNLKNAKLPSRWMSPEAYFDQTYTSASDVWSFGVVMWEIVAFGYTPYKKLNGRELQNKVVKENYRLPQPYHCPPQLYTIMQRCWHINPSYRPTFKELQRELEYLVDVIENHQPVYENVMKEANLYEDVTIDAVGFAIG